MNNLYIRNNYFRIGATKKRSRGTRSSVGGLKNLLPSIPNWGSLTLGVILGVAITSILFFYFSTNDITLKIPAKASRDAMQAKYSKGSNSRAKKESMDVKQTEVLASQPPEPRFDFYTELTKNQSEVNQATKTSVLDLKSPPKAINKYLVQVAAFKHRSDADELKAKLTLNGLDAKIQLAKLDDGMEWHRVVIGPFKNEASAIAQKEALRTLDINAALIIKQ